MLRNKIEVGTLVYLSPKLSSQHSYLRQEPTVLTISSHGHDPEIQINRLSVP